MIVIASLSVPTWDAYARAVGPFLVLLAVQVAFFLVLPVEIPGDWRTRWRAPFEGTLSQRFLGAALGAAVFYAWHCWVCG